MSRVIFWENYYAITFSFQRIGFRSLRIYSRFDLKVFIGRWSSRYMWLYNDCFITVNHHNVNLVAFTRNRKREMKVQREIAARVNGIRFPLLTCTKLFSYRYAWKTSRILASSSWILRLKVNFRNLALRTLAPPRVFSPSSRCTVDKSEISNQRKPEFYKISKYPQFCNIWSYRKVECLEERLSACRPRGRWSKLM